MNTLRLFFGSTPQAARDAYKAWWDQQAEIEVVGTPTVEQEDGGWKVSVWHRPARPASGDEAKT